MGEVASTYAELMIQALLNVHALTNMHRSSGNDGYRESAEKWLPKLDLLLADLRRELTKEPRP